MAVAYPSTIPLALIDKTRTQPAAFRMSDPRRGYGYVEPSGTDTPAFWALTWRMSGAQAQLFWQWFFYDTQRGVLPFTLPVRTEFGLVTHEMQFLPDGLMPAKQIGSDVWEYSATVMARALLGARRLDPYFQFVRLLLNAQSGVLTDSSLAAHAITQGGGGSGVSIVTSPTLNGQPVYQVTPDHWLIISDMTGLTDFGAAEFVWERWVSTPNLPTAGGDRTMTQCGPIQFNYGAAGIVNMTTFVNGVGVSLGAPAGTAIAGTFQHLAIRRVAISPSVHRLLMSVDGVVVDSVDIVPAYAVAATGFELPIKNSPYLCTGNINFGSVRCTVGSGRGYGSGTFTPDQHPFPLGS